MTFYSGTFLGFFLFICFAANQVLPFIEEQIISLYLWKPYKDKQNALPNVEHNVLNEKPSQCATSGLH